MTIEFDSNRILSKKEREERVLDLHFNQNKNYRQIAQDMKMSLRDIGEIINRAREEKERHQHKSISVQAYELFSKGKNPLDVAIDLNIGEAPATQHYTEYLRLVQLDSVTQLYLDLKGDIWNFVSLCKQAKVAKMGIPQVVNLLRIANSNLPSVQRRYEQLQEHNTQFESILRTKSKELQNLSNQITDTGKTLDIIKSEYGLKTSMLRMLQQQAAKMETFVNNYKNNDQEYIKLKKSIEDKVHESLSYKKRFLELAIFSVIESMRNKPDKYSSLVYHNNNNEKSSKYNTNSSRQILPPPPYDSYTLEHYKSILLEESEKLYNDLVNQLVCEVINENVTEQSVPNQSTLPALSLEGADNNKQEHNEQNGIPTKNEQ
jgi:hypothetical protein